MAEVKKRKRVQLSAEEKRCFVEKIKADSSDENINSLVDEWNAEHKERRIDVFHLRRLPVPKFSAEDDFYASVATKLAIELANPVAKTSYEPRINGVDYMDRMTKRIDPDKVPDIDESTLESLRFPFENVAYNRSETEAQREASLKRLRHDFREHFNTKGLVLGRFEDFINPADRSELDRLCGPSAWIPSGVSGPWKVVGDAILKNKRILNSVKQTAVFSEQGEKEDRINPKHVTLKPLFLKYASVSDQAALSAVLRISETAYSGVADLLPTDARKNSSRRKYAINHDMDPMYLSFLSCLSVRTKVQREHMDDHERGVAGLWGLVDEEQYLIFWKHSYEMNLELEKIYEFRDFVIQVCFFSLLSLLILVTLSRMGRKNPPDGPTMRSGTSSHPSISRTRASLPTADLLRSRFRCALGVCCSWIS